MGRPSKYNSHVQPHLAQVSKWVRSGATMEEVAKALDINVSTLYEYQKQYKEFADALHPPRAAVCCDIKAAMHKKAMGFYYEEKKHYTKEDENGITHYTEITEKYCPPSERAAAMLLNNYDEGWKNADAFSVKMREQEFLLREKIARANNFNLE